MHVYVCVNVCMHVCIYVNARTHKSMYVHTYICVCDTLLK